MDDNLLNVLDRIANSLESISDSMADISEKLGNDLNTSIAQSLEYINSEIEDINMNKS